MKHTEDIPRVDDCRRPNAGEKDSAAFRPTVNNRSKSEFSDKDSATPGSGKKPERTFNWYGERRVGDLGWGLVPGPDSSTTAANTLAPAFSSTGQVAVFVVLLVAALLSPWLIGKKNLPTREQTYSSIGWRSGSFPYMYRQIFEEKSDIDIAFIGSSHMYFDIDTPYVQKQLSQALGRPATVVSLCWFDPGFDAFYFMTRDLLEHRKVRMLVFYDDRTPNQPPEQPHISSWRWVRYDDGADLAGLPLSVRSWYYYGEILGLPRNLLAKFRPNLPPPASPGPFLNQNYFHALYPPDRLGAFTSQVAYLNRPDLFAPYRPKTAAGPSDVSVYSPETRDKFYFYDAPTAPLQSYFAGKFLTVASQHRTHLVCLNLPILNERNDETIPEGRLSIDTFSPQATLVGIPPAQLFQGLDLDDLHKLYVDPVHLNANGQAYFTSIVTPALIQLYEKSKP